jgi:hypothetical protein
MRFCQRAVRVTGGRLGIGLAAARGAPPPVRPQGRRGTPAASAAILHLGSDAAGVSAGAVLSVGGGSGAG